MCSCLHFSDREGCPRRKAPLIINPSEHQPCLQSSEIVYSRGSASLTLAQRVNTGRMLAYPTQTSHLITWAFVIPTLPTCPHLKRRESCQGRGLGWKHHSQAGVLIIVP